MRYKFLIIRLVCLRIFGSAKRGDYRTLMGCSSPNFSPELEPIHRIRLVYTYTVMVAPVSPAGLHSGL